MSMPIGYRHFLSSKKAMHPVNLDMNIDFFFIKLFFNADVLIVIGLLDSGCVKLWAFDPRTATSNVRLY